MKPQRTMQEYLKAAARARKLGGAASCLDEEKLVAFYSAQLEESEMEAIRDHLAECPKCLELAREARKFLKAMNEPIEPVATAAVLPWYRAHKRELFLLAAAVIVVVSVMLFLEPGWRVQAPSEQAEKPLPPSGTTPLQRENPWLDLEIAKAEYTPAVASPDDLIWRDEGTETTGAAKPSAFAQAMRPYERNDFARAEQQLAQFLEKNPKHAEAHFYRGVSLLLLGRTSDAIAPLESAIEHGQGRVDEEAHWYLALAYLKADEPSKALEQLNVVIGTSGKHRAEAEQLQQQINK